MSSFTFGEAEQQQALPVVTNFFDQYPPALQAYGGMALYHMTHSSRLPAIMEEGLVPNQDIFPPAHGQFLLDMLDKHGQDTAPSTVHYIKDRIIDGGNLYLSQQPPDLSKIGAYGIPERLVLLMRGMHSLQHKHSLDGDEQIFAMAAFEEHMHTLTALGSAITALEVSPFAPAVLNSRLGNIGRAEVENIDDALFFTRYIDGYPGNIVIPGAIGPEHIKVIDGSLPISRQDLNRVYVPATYLNSIC